MTNSTAIQVSQLGKKYQIGKRRVNGLFHMVQKRAFARKENEIVSRESKDNSFWALKDITFSVGENEVVGIIGRNGSGKSTLLKILSRVTEPTEGQAIMCGRSASLLEVGTGFHPELTGRENVYLNGSILGMSKSEINSKFDAILDFAEVEKFIDTAIKHYSSGMAVRLAFAVAAHLEPEILIVDEVLAVGDLKFQKKCLQKMKDVGNEGKTVLFVTHQMNAVRKLCNSCIWLEEGKIKMTGATAQVVSGYESASNAPFAVVADGPTQFLSWTIDGQSKEESHLLETAGEVTIRFRIRVQRPIKGGLHGLALWSSRDELVWSSALANLTFEPGIHEFVYSLPTLPVRPGPYRWHLSLWEGHYLIDEWHAVPEMIVATAPLTHPSDDWAGILNIGCQVDVRQIS